MIVGRRFGSMPSLHHQRFHFGHISHSLFLCMAKLMFSTGGSKQGFDASSFADPRDAVRPRYTCLTGKVFITIVMVLIGIDKF